MTKFKLSSLFLYHYKKKVFSLPVMISAFVFILCFLIFNLFILNFISNTNLSDGVTLLNQISFVFNIFVFSIFISFVTFVSFKKDILNSYIKLEQQTITKIFWIFLVRFMVFFSILLTYLIIIVCLSELSYIGMQVEQIIISAIFRIKYAFYFVYGLLFFSFCFFINLIAKGVFDFVFTILLGLIISISPFIGSFINTSNKQNVSLIQNKINYALFSESILYGSKFYEEFKDDDNINQIFDTEEIESFWKTINENFDKMNPETQKENVDIINWDTLVDSSTNNEIWESLLTIFYKGEVYNQIEDESNTNTFLFSNTEIGIIFEDIYKSLIDSEFMNRSIDDNENLVTPFYRELNNYENWIEIDEVLNYLIQDLPQYSHLFNFIKENYPYYQWFSSYKNSSRVMNQNNFQDPYLYKGLFYYEMDPSTNSNGNNKYEEMYQKIPEVKIINWIILNSYRSSLIFDVSYFKYNNDFISFDSVMSILDTYENKIKSSQWNIFNSFLLMYQSKSLVINNLSTFFIYESNVFKIWPLIYSDFSSIEDQIIEADENFELNSNQPLFKEKDFLNKKPEIKIGFKSSVAYICVIIISILSITGNYILFKRTMYLL